jgi:hypothetical protein
MSSFIIWGFLALIVFTAGNVWAYLEYGFDWFSIVIGAAIALFIFVMTAGRLEFIGRPREVDIIASGIVLHQRLGRRPVDLPWTAMLKLNLPPVKHGLIGWNTSNGYLFVTEKKAYTLDRNVAEAIIDRYRSETGRYLENEYDGYNHQGHGDGLLSKN